MTELLPVLFVGGPWDGVEIPPRMLRSCALGQTRTIGHGGRWLTFRFEEEEDGRRVARLIVQE